MNRNPFSEVLDTDDDHIVCFGSDGTVFRWSEFVERASGVRDSLAALPGARWAVDIDDVYEFACAMMGCWAAGKTAVIAARQIIRREDLDTKIDGVLTSAPVRSTNRLSVALTQVVRANKPIKALDPGSRIVLYTSGSTGKPKEVGRALHNVEAELSAFESLWGTRLRGSSMYSTVSHRHVYGLLFRVLWPLLSRRPFATFDFQYPEQLLGPVGSGNVLITSPALLKRIGHFDPRAGDWAAVFSSGGLLPRDSAMDSKRVLGTHPIEVLGSTETSGVGWRRQRAQNNEMWTVLPTASVRVDRDGFLEVESQFSGQAGWYRMGDLAKLVPDGRFELLGRGDSIAKIEEKRISLTEIERLLLEHPFVVAAAAVALADDTRQFIGVALGLSRTGAEELARVGRLAFSTTLKDSLRSRIEPVALPRKFRYLDELPVNSQGKRTQAAIEKLFE
ncbi:AMP-binding protein [Candidatus Rariloculus sp.]|uniref:AMP-binding protein n=1 Tax=Candidatus Rariloculus sp. TaxID=3101265 RepID=UPI003D13FE9D